MSEESENLEVLAGEYVLGTLDDAARRDVERRMARDPEFAALVEAWTHRLSPLTEGIPDAQPSGDVWARIASSLDAHRESAPGAGVVAGLERRVNFWRWLAAGATAAAATLAIYVSVLVPQAPAPADTRFVAVLSEDGTRPAWLATVDLTEKRIAIRPVARPDVDDRSLELWLISGEDTPPRSLGLLDPEIGISLSIPEAVRAGVRSSSVLAVSLEPAGGSPTGLPTGPVVYTGTLLSVKE